MVLFSLKTKDTRVLQFRYFIQIDLFILERNFSPANFIDDLFLPLAQGNVVKGTFFDD